MQGSVPLPPHPLRNRQVISQNPQTPIVHLVGPWGWGKGGMGPRSSKFGVARLEWQIMSLEWRVWSDPPEAPSPTQAGSWPSASEYGVSQSWWMLHGLSLEDSGERVMCLCDTERNVKYFLLRSTKQEHKAKFGRQEHRKANLWKRKKIFIQECRNTKAKLRNAGTWGVKTYRNTCPSN